MPTNAEGVESSAQTAQRHPVRQRAGGDSRAWLGPVGHDKAIDSRYKCVDVEGFFEHLLHAESRQVAEQG